jgi:hypothetical protein
MLTLRVLQPSRSAMLSAVAAGSVSGHECRARFRAGRTNLIGGAEPSTRWNSALSLCTNAKRYRLRAGSDLYGGEPVILPLYALERCVSQNIGISAAKILSGDGGRVQTAGRTRGELCCSTLARLHLLEKGFYDSEV